MGKKGITLLILGFIAFLVIMLVVAGVVAALLIHKSDKKDEGKDDTAETQDSDNVIDSSQQEVTSKNVYAIVNCKLYQLSATKATQVKFTNKTKVTCFRNRVIDGDWSIVDPSYDDLNKTGVSSSLFLLDLKTAAVVQVKYTTETSKTVAYDSVAKKLYSYIVGEGLYSGTLTSPLGTKIYDPKAELLGRGGMFGDELALRLSPDLTKIALIDTYTSINKDGSDYKQIKVLDTAGTVIFSDNGTAAKWINNSKLIYMGVDLNSSTSGKVKVYDIAAEDTNEINGFDHVYHFDVMGNYLLIDYFKNPTEYKSAELRTAIMKINDGSIINDAVSRKSDNYLLDTKTIIGHTTFDCSGEWDSGAQYPCGIDAVYSFYEKSIASLVLSTSKETSLLVYSEAEMF